MPHASQHLIERAKAGDSEALGQLFEHYRPYLRLLAQRQLGVRVAARVDASDIVQSTFLEAQRDFIRFHGQHPGQLAAWLRQILQNNVAHTIEKHVHAQKRTTAREQPLDAGSQGGSALADRHSSPSQRALRGEAAVLLAQAIQSLPESQREAIRLRYLEGWSLAQLAAYFGRSEVAVAGLVKRGLRGLRRYFKQLA